MKKFLIMSLTFLAFALIGCGSKKVTKAECEKDTAKQWNEETKECEDKTYTITNQHEYGVDITITAGDVSITLSENGGCAVITESQFATLKVQNQYNKVLCDSTNQPVMMAEADDPATADVNEAETEKDDDCKAGNYNVITEAPRVLTSADAMNDDASCKALGTAEPATDATPAKDDATGDMADGATTATAGEGAPAEEADASAPAEGETVTGAEDTTSG